MKRIADHIWSFIIVPAPAKAISWLGDTAKFGVSRVGDICRACATSLDVDAGAAPNRVSFQVGTTRMYVGYKSQREASYRVSMVGS